MNILKAHHKDTSGAVRAYGKVSKEFRIGNGVRQGDVLEPILFNLFFDAVINMSLQKHLGNGITILFNTKAELVGSRKQMRDQTLISNLEYADDMCLRSKSMDELEEMFLELDLSCNQMGLPSVPKRQKFWALLTTNNNFQEVSLYRAQMNL